MAYSGSILAAILPQRYEKEIIQRNNLAKIEKIQRNNSAISSLFRHLSHHPSHFRAVYPRNLEGQEVQCTFVVQFCKNHLKEI